MTTRRADVLILGAGPAGAALAIALKRDGAENVLMIDSPARRPMRIGEAAAPGLGALLRRLGLADRLEDDGHRPCHGNRSVWGADEPALTDFMIRGHGPGWHLDRAAFDSWLRAEAVAAGAALLSPARLDDAHRESGGWQARIRWREQTLALNARWIVDATGRPASFARRNGARLYRLDRLIALAVLMEPKAAAGFERYSRIEAAQNGWWYAAHLPEGKVMLALMTDSDIARTEGLFSGEGFTRAWEKTREVSCLAVPGPHVPTGFAAGTQYVDQAIAPGWLALGDALMAFDPLSASGITGAMEDALAAGDALGRLLQLSDQGEACALRRGYSARANNGLQRYMAERRGIYAAEQRWPDSPFWRRRSRPAQTARPASIPS